jgi:hypothetical protein
VKFTMVFGFILMGLIFTSYDVKAITVFDLKFNYIKQSIPNEQMEKSILLGTLSATLEGQLIGQLGIQQPFMVDEIFTSQDMEKTVMLKMGFSIDDESLMHKVTTLNESFLYHSKTKSGLPFAIMFYGFKINEVHSTLYSIPGKTKSSLWSILKISMIQNALANQESCSDGSVSFITQMMGHFNSNPGLRCLIGVFKGAWDSTGGIVVGLGTAVFNTIVQPIQTARSVWQGAHQFWNGVQAFYRDALGVMKKIYKHFDSLSIQKKAEIGCRLASAIGTGALVTFFSAGEAGPAVLIQIAQVLKEIDAVTGPERKLPESKIEALRLAQPLRKDMKTQKK